MIMRKDRSITATLCHFRTIIVFAWGHQKAVIYKINNVQGNNVIWCASNYFLIGSKLVDATSMLKLYHCKVVSFRFED